MERSLNRLRRKRYSIVAFRVLGRDGTFAEFEALSVAAGDEMDLRFAVPAEFRDRKSLPATCPSNQ
jgi:hypothetical protein